MKNSHLALGACIVSYALTAMAYMAPQQFIVRRQVQAERADYRSIFTQFLPAPESRKPDPQAPVQVVKAQSLIVVTDPPHCGPCRLLEPTLDKLVKEGYDIVEETPAQYRQRPLRERQRISSIPTLLFCDKDGNVKSSTVGNKSEEFIKKYLDKPTPGGIIE